MIQLKPYRVQFCGVCTRIMFLGFASIIYTAKDKNNWYTKKGTHAVSRDFKWNCVAINLREITIKKVCLVSVDVCIT